MKTRVSSSLFVLTYPIMSLYFCVNKRGGKYFDSFASHSQEQKTLIRRLIVRTGWNVSEEDLPLLADGAGDVLRLDKNAPSDLVNLVGRTADKLCSSLGY